METRIEEVFDRWANEQREIGRGDNVVIGVSGGPDSLCLLFLLYQYSKRVGFNVIAVHFNHKIRGAASDEDECGYLDADSNAYPSYTSILSLGSP